MRVLHVIPSVSPSQGGPSFALPLMVRALVARDVEVDVATTNDDGPAKHSAVALGQRLERDGAGYYFFRKQVEFYKVSLPLARWVSRQVKNYDVVHIHALFSFTSNAAARAAASAGVPYIIRPLGVLNRWGMTRRRRWLKALSFACVEQPVLRRAAAVHFTSIQEEQEARQCGVDAPGVVIPLAVDAAAFGQLSGPSGFLERFPASAGRPLILFLSRLDQKKGLELLLEAFAALRPRHQHCQLVIAGEGDPGYVSELKNQARALGIADAIVWTGFLGGAEKLSALAAATVFTLPSYSENFGIAAVEALAAGVPSVLTEGVAVSREAAGADAAVVVASSVSALTEGLGRLLDDPELRARLAANARRLVDQRFSLDALGGALVKLYKAQI